MFDWSIRTIGFVIVTFVTIILTIVFDFLRPTIQIPYYIIILTGLVVIFLILTLFKKNHELKILSSQNSKLDIKSGQSKTTKKILPLYFPINKTLSNGHSSWTVRVESRFGHRNEDIENFIYNMDLSVPFCSICGSSLDEVSDYVLCQNKSCEKYGLGWNVEEEIQDGKDLLNTFTGEVRNNPKKWILIYREEFEKYTNKKNDDFEPPKIIRSIL